MKIEYNYCRLRIKFLLSERWQISLVSQSGIDQQLSFDDLRHLLVEKRRSLRKARLENFQKTGWIDSLNHQSNPSERQSRTLTGTVLDRIGTFPQKTSVRQRTWVDHLLLAIEIAAVMSFLFILYQGFIMMRGLNQEVSSALIQPTLTPTALISAVILPSGHTPPNSPQGVQPNESEIPEHLKPLVQSLAQIPVPTSSPQQAIRIQIPAIDVDSPIVQGDGWEQLKKGVGQHIGTPNPDENGNIVLSAHNDIFGEIFRDLDRLKTGDEIILLTSASTYTYNVKNSQIIEPTQIEVMAPSQDKMVTLISCYPYMVDNKRIAVTATLIE